MSGDPDSIVLRALRHLEDRMDAVNGKPDQLVTLVSAIEHGVAEIKLGLAATQNCLDRLDVRVGRIERRLELA